MTILGGAINAFDMKRRGLKRGIKYIDLKEGTDDIKLWEKLLGLQMMNRPELQCYVVGYNDFIFTIDRYDEVHNKVQTARYSWVWWRGINIPIPFMKRNHYVFITTRYR